MKAGIKRAREDENDIVDDRSQQDQVKPKRATPITYDDFIDACETGNIEVVEKGIVALTVEVIASHLNQALRRAARNGHLLVVNRLLEIDVVRQTATECENYALGWAAQNGHLPVVNRLLEIDSVRQIAAADNNSVLLAAVLYGHLSVVNRLLEIDAVRQAVTTKDNVLLCQAAKHAFLSVVNPVVNRLLEMDEVRRTYKIQMQREVKFLGSWENWSKKIVFSNNEIEPIETVKEWLAAKYPDFKRRLEKENRKNEARALYFAYRAAKSKPACSHSVLKKYGQRDTVVKIMQMVLNSPPPAQQLDEPLTKKLR